MLSYNASDRWLKLLRLFQSYERHQKDVKEGNHSKQCHNKQLTFCQQRADNKNKTAKLYLNIKYLLKHAMICVLLIQIIKGNRNGNIIPLKNLLFSLLVPYPPVPVNLPFIFQTLHTLYTGTTYTLLLVHGLFQSSVVTAFSCILKMEDQRHKHQVLHRQPTDSVLKLFHYFKQETEPVHYVTQTQASPAQHEIS